MLTRHGWGAVTLAAAAAIVGRLFGVLELLVLGAGILALVLACVVWVHSRTIALSVNRRVLPAALRAGDVGRVELIITNNANTGTSQLSLWEPVGGMGGATLRLAPMRRHETVAANYRLPALRRGTVVFGPLTVERRDPFGLCSKRRAVGSTHEVVVFAAHHELHLPSGMGGSGPLGEHLRARALGRVGSEFHSLREYADGDDLRQIHWRASARSDTLKVRQVEPEGLRHCTVELDTTASEYSPEGFERAVSAAAGAVYAATQSGLRLRLLLGEGTDLRNTTSTAAMFVLANCSASDQPRSRGLNAPLAEGLGLTFVITGSPQSAAVRAARLSLAPTDVLVIIACSSVATTGRDFIINAVDSDRFLSSWTALTGAHAPTGARPTYSAAVGA